MSLSKKRCCEEAKTRVKEKLSAIDKQRNIIVAYIDDIVAKAHAEGEQLLAIKDRARFTKQLRNSISQLETALTRLFLIRSNLQSDDEETDQSETSDIEGSPKKEKYLQLKGKNECEDIAKEPGNRYFDEVLKQLKQEKEDDITPANKEEKQSSSSPKNTASPEEQKELNKSVNTESVKGTGEMKACEASEEKAILEHTEQVLMQVKGDMKTNVDDEKESSQSNHTQDHESEMPKVEKCNWSGASEEQERKKTLRRPSHEFTEWVEEKRNDAKKEKITAQCPFQYRGNENNSNKIPLGKPCDTQDIYTSHAKPLNRDKPIEVAAICSDSKLLNRTKPIEVADIGPDSKPLNRTKTIEVADIGPDSKPLNRTKPIEVADIGPDSKPLNRDKPIEVSDIGPDSKPLNRDKPIESPNIGPNETRTEEKNKSKENPSPKKVCKERPKPPAATTTTTIASAANENGHKVKIKPLDLSNGRSSLDVYVHLIQHPTRIWISPQSPELDDMQDALNAYFGRLSDEEDAQLKVEKPYAGMYCCTKFSQDNNWYRVRILETTQDLAQTTIAGVLYIDFGNAEDVNASTLRAIPSRFTTLPAHIIPCCLAEVAPTGGGWEWADEVNVLLGEVTLNRGNVYAVLSSMPDCPMLLVELYIPDDKDPQPSASSKVRDMIDVNKLLIRKGYARPADNHDIAKELIRACSKRPPFSIARKSVIQEIDILEDQKPYLGDEKYEANNSPLQRQAVKRKLKKSGSSDEVKEALKEAQEHIKQPEGSHVKLAKLEYLSTSSSNKSALSTSKQSSSEDSIEFKRGSLELKQSDMESREAIEEESCRSSSDSWKNAVCDDDFEEDLNKSIDDMNKQMPDKQQTELSDIPSVSSSQDGNPLASNVCDKEDTSVLDASCVSTSSVKKLKQLGLPKHLPKSCHYSDTYNKLMESSDDEEELPIQEFEPAPLVPEADGCIRFMFSHIDSPSNFWIHHVSHDTVEMVDSIMKGLDEYMQQQKPKPLSNLKGACAAKFSDDEHMYRAKILDVRKDEEKTMVHVFYVDFGNTEWVPAESVFFMPTEFLKMPPQAILCCLDDVKPVEADEDNIVEEEKGADAANTVEWSVKAIELFKEMSPANQTYMAYIMTETTDAPVQLSDVAPLPVLVADTSGEENRWLGPELAKQGLANMREVEEMFPTEANQLKHFQEQQDKERVSEWNPMALDYVSIRNSYQVDISDPGVAAIGYKATDEKRVCRFYNMRKGCKDGENCPYEHIKYKDQAAITSDRREVYATDNQVAAPKEGSWVAIEITTFFSPAHFYGFFPFGIKPIIEAVTCDDIGAGGDGHGYGGRSDLTNSESLELLMKDLCDHYNKEKYPDSDLIMRAPGEIVVALFEADAQWYRARVIQHDPDNGTVKVFYVDYGNTEHVKEKNIRNMEHRFMHYPFQAMECFLPLEPVTGTTWSAEAKAAFQRLTDGKYLFAHILARSNHGLLTVELYDTEVEEVNINATLIDLSFAKAAVDMPLVFMKHPTRRNSSLASPSSTSSRSTDRANTSASNTSLHIIPG